MLKKTKFLRAPRAKILTNSIAFHSFLQPKKIPSADKNRQEKKSLRTKIGKSWTRADLNRLRIGKLA